MLKKGLKMTDTVNKKRFSTGEEIANTISHGVGVFVAIAAASLLIVFSAMKGSVWHIVSFSIFGFSMILVFISSTFNHGLTNEKAKHVFHILDQTAIYVLIAGTYTPFALVVLHGALGWVVFGIEWGLAIIGIVMKSVFPKNYNKGMSPVSVGFYIVMGWLALAFIKPMLQVIDVKGLIFLFAGGLSYSIGVIFFAWKKMPYHHLIWHLFVIAGAVLHFFSVFFYVLGVRL